MSCWLLIFDTSFDDLRHIIRDVSGVMMCSVSFNIRHPHSGRPAEANQTPACV